MQASKTRVLRINVIRSFVRFNLRGKKIEYQWEHETAGPEERSPRWMSDRDIKNQNDELMRQRQATDYRIDFFFSKEAEKVKAKEEDPLFGKLEPGMKPFDRVSSLYLGRRAFYDSEKELIAIKSAYLPQLSVPEELPIPGLTVFLEKVSKVFRSSDLESLTSSPEWNALVAQTVNEIENTEAQMVPKIALKLGIGLNLPALNPALSPIWTALERSVWLNLNLLTSVEVAAVFYALSTSPPKRCSSELRSALRTEIVNRKLFSVSTEDLLAIHTAFRSDLNSLKVHRLCVKELASRGKKIDLWPERSPVLPLQCIYTFANARPKRKFRKRLLLNEEQSQTEENEELDMIERLYMPSVVANIESYKLSEILQLLSTLRLLNLMDYDLVVPRLERFVLEESAGVSFAARTAMLYGMAKCGPNGMGSRDFWLKVQAQEIAQGQLSGEVDIDAVSKLLYALSYNKVLSLDLFTKRFGSVLFEALGSPDKLNFNALSLLASTAVYLDVALPEKAAPQATRLLKEVTLCLSRKTEWVPLIYYESIKQLLLYVSRRFPEWNLEPAALICYHAEKNSTTERKRPMMMTPEFERVRDALGEDLELPFFFASDFENLYLLDFANDEKRVAVLLQKDSDCLWDSDPSIRVPSAAFDAKCRLLTLSGWTICVIDFKDFLRMGAARNQWLKDKVEQSLKLARDLDPQPHRRKLAEIFDRAERLMTDHLRFDPAFPDHVKEAAKIAALKLKAPQLKPSPAVKSKTPKA